MHFGIIAAGEGSRLSQEGSERAKPLIEIGGEAIIGRLIRIFEMAGADSVSVVVRENMPEVKDYLYRMSLRRGIPLNVREATTPSSMHSFHELTRMMPGNERFVATTVDTVFQPEPFLRYVEAFADAGKDIAGYMGVSDFIEDEKPLYVETDEEMRIVAFEDRPEGAAKYVSGGIYGLDGRGVEVLEECMERGIERMRNFQRELILSGLTLKAFPMGKIIDIDHISDIKRAEDFIENQRWQI